MIPYLVSLGFCTPDGYVVYDQFETYPHIQHLAIKPIMQEQIFFIPLYKILQLCELVFFLPL